MSRTLFAWAVAIVFVVSISACQKNEEKLQLPAGHPGMGGVTPTAGLPDIPRVERQVIVPKEVKAKWKAVKLKIEDKMAKRSKDYVVAVGSELAVPDTGISVRVRAFLPDFKMGDRDITTASDKLNNPAAEVVVREKGKEEWKGWLYSLYPNIHPFQHERIAMTLVGGVAKTP
jgi:hypothetical protein